MSTRDLPSSNKTVDSEISGNVIDLCPVGALTSKPFRYSARPWELSRRKTVSPHDGLGANMIVQVKNNRVMRALPLENEAINECWLADRDRFSYEALSSDARLTRPMVKQGGQWIETDGRRAGIHRQGLRGVTRDHGADAIGFWPPRTARWKNSTWPRNWPARWAWKARTPHPPRRLQP